ncbi:hypothetical protein BZA70DRAFT_268276 [Myxozyma melibiosi]|uniref:tRNA-binding domain-containing protein n=1 Tax=Myxozyma melibiosi TaxID=54550 RepID=A0ABR1F5R5_9ASCO
MADPSPAAIESKDSNVESPTPAVEAAPTTLQPDQTKPTPEKLEGPSHMHPKLPDVEAATFPSIDMRIGTITSAKPNKKARMPAYVLKIDFGPVIGVKTSSAQITQNYSTEGLVGRQIVAAVNLGVRRIGGVKSEVLVLGVDKLGDGVISLLGVDGSTPNGTRIS